MWTSIHRCFLLLIACWGLAACAVRPAPAPAPLSSHAVDVTADDPACAYFYFLWGKNAELHQQHEAAREAYEKALICDGKAVHVMQSLGLLLLKMRQFEDGIAVLEQVLDLRPDEIRLRVMVARLLLDLGRQDEAMRRLEEVRRLDPEDMRVLLMQASILATEKRWDEAEEVLAPLVQREDRPDAYVLLARMQRQQKRYEQALAAYERALLMGRNSDILLELAGLHQEFKQFDRALLLYEELLLHDPGNGRALLGMVQACLTSGLVERAREETRRFRRANRPNADLDLAVAKLFLQGKELAQARGLLQDVLRRADLAEARYLLAILLAEEQEFAAALRQLDHVPGDVPEYARAMLLRGRIRIAMGQTGQAIETLGELVRSGAADGDVYALLATLLQREQRGEEARQLLLGAMEQYPDDDDLHYEYGMLLERQGRRDEALAAMEALIRRHPGHAGALNYVGYSWADANVHLDKALEYIQRALAQDPDNGYIRDSLGWVYFRLGRLRQAREELEASHRILGDDPNVLEHLGDVHQRLGLGAQAAGYFRRALELSEDEQERQRLRDKLAQPEQGD